jgi:L-ribulose-5-phosphate 3-epimerase
MPVSFNTANFVARPLGYHMPEGWGQGDQATQAFFRPLPTFRERFRTMLAEIKELGFDSIDLWTVQVYPAWATAAHIAQARDALIEYGLTLKSLVGWFGATPAEFTGACRLAVSLNCDLLGGRTALLETDRPWVLKTLEQYSLRLAVENHPETSAEALRAHVGGDAGGGRLGVCVDTGWFATQGVNVPAALEALAEHLMLVHLKDVRAAGAHDTCRYGDGVVPIAECVQTLGRLGYTGHLSIEHEPAEGDPRADIQTNLALVRRWLEKSS